MNDSKKAALVNVETHFMEYQGKVYAESLMDSLFWQKYLNVFDKLYVLVRMKKYEGEDLNKWIVSDCDNVVFLPLPDYRGPKGYIFSYFQIHKKIKEYVDKYRDISCAIIRSPSPLGYKLLSYWKKTGKPYGMEIVSNLSDRYFYSIGIIHSILYKRLHNQTKKYAKRATGVAYVTKEVLQKIYPTNGISANYSSIDLPSDYFYQRPLLDNKRKEYVLIHVSTLALDCKGNEEFLKVQKNLIDMGYNVRSVVIGGGKLKEKYEIMAHDLGIRDKVRFTGHISTKEAIRQELINADMFLFPTQTEGLPRVVIEAMACSLPCISSNIPTIRELLDDEWMCDPMDVNLMVEKVKRLIDDTNIYNEVSCRNYRRAQDYEYSMLNKRRMDFYRKIST